MNYKINTAIGGKFKYVVVIHDGKEDYETVEIRKWCASCFKLDENWKYIQSQYRLLIYLKSDTELNLFTLRWA